MVTKNKLKEFAENHAVHDMSTAKFIYSWHLTPEMDSTAASFINNLFPAEDEDMEMLKTIYKTEEPEKLVELMRKPMRDDARYILRKKCIERESEAAPFIQRRTLTSRQDRFIESAVDFFLNSNENYSAWIRSNYDSIKSDYMRSLLCIVLGFRGDLSDAEKMMSEAERMRKLYPDEEYDQGPILAVNELLARWNEGAL